MLTKEAADKILSQWLVPADEIQVLLDEFDEDNDKKSTRFLPWYLKLPKKLRGVACGLYGLDETGTARPEQEYEQLQASQRAAHGAFLALGSGDRRKVLAIPFPKMASAVDQALTWLESAPFQSGYQRKAFRAPGHPEFALENQRALLAELLVLAERYQGEVLTVPWCAIWAPHARASWHALEHRIVPVLAAAIDAGGAIGDEVFEILLQCGRNEHEHGSMGRHVVGSLLAARRPDGWEFIEKMLLAAQRQEGLRQVILETVDLSHPDALSRILKVIQEQDLARFSAVTRALNVWLGYAWDSASVKVVNQTIDQITSLLDDPSAREKGAASQDPETAYSALWAISVFDAAQSIAPALKMMRSPLVELRYAALVHLCNLQLPSLTREPLKQAIDDEDRRIAYVAAAQASTMPLGDVGREDDLFERLERLIARLPAKPEIMPALVWPWSSVTLDRSSIASRLPAALQKRPFSRMVPYLQMLTSWDRARAIGQLSKLEKWTPELRDMVLRLAGDPTARVREEAIQILAGLTLEDAECQLLEGMLTRTAADLRSGVIGLLKQLPDERALASVDRLLSAKSPPQRLAGLELVREIKDAERAAAECQSRAARYRAGRSKITPDEDMHLQAIEAQASATAGLSFDNALGLMNPAELSSGTPPRMRKVVLWSTAAEACVRDLDRLIHEHREAPITVGKHTVLLGTTTWGFPQAENSPKALRELPLREVWETWVKNRPKKLRDKDGLELVRAANGEEFTSGYRYKNVMAWTKGSADRKPIASLVGFEVPKLRYPRLTPRLLDWMLILDPPQGVFDYLADCLEALCALVGQADLDSLDPAQAKPLPKSGYYFTEGELEDWRKHSPIAHWHKLFEMEIRRKLTEAQIKRAWELLCWFDRPVSRAMRERPSSDLLFLAYRHQFTTLHHVADYLLGPREQGAYRTQFSLLAAMTDRRRPYAEVLRQFPEIKKLLDDAVAIVLDIELERGDTPTIATAPAEDIASLSGMDTLRRLLAKIGKAGFKVAGYHSSEGHRLPVLTNLVSVTYPGDDDTPEKFNQVMKRAVADKEVPEERLIQLAFLSPQWVKHVEGYFKWKGMSEAIYWFLAHMSFLWGSNSGEKAAVAAGMVEETADEQAPTNAAGGTTSAPDSDENIDDEVAPAAPAAPKLSPWQRLIAERTPLSSDARNAGAIDVDWFHRVHSDLGAKRWQELAQAARFASNAAQAKKAQLIADVLVGKADLKSLITGIEQRQLKDNVRLLGLFPLPTGAKRDAELKRRFNILQAYQRYARGLSGLTKPQAMQALEIGLRNLAATAGYVDPIRLEWALGAEELKDLGRGPVAATKDGVTVSLRINESSQPELSAARGDKPLKSTPAAVKKDPKIAELFERAKEIKRKASRLRAALEQCMCRGDVFSSKELGTLMVHPLVAPLLERLVLVGNGILGYPDKMGKALRNHAGQLEPVKKDEELRIAHPHDMFAAEDWADWQRECFQAERIQPFKQIFRELYVLTKQERADHDASHRYAGQQINPQQAYALWGSRGWNTGDDVFKTFHDIGLTAVVGFNHGITTPLEVEGLTLDAIHFHQRTNDKRRLLSLEEVPHRVFSEVMRDCDLVVSVAHRGGVDPEASASTVEMRASLVRETSQLMGLKNVRFKANHVLVDGSLANYSVHLGSGSVHRLPGGALCIVPVHAQHRGRLFLPFADDDPRSAEVLSKVLLLARDQEILDPTILAQLRI